MINLLNDIRKLLIPIKRKILLSLGRAVLEAVNNDGKTMKLQVTVLEGETLTDMERFQDYGFESYPFPQTQVAAIFLGGNRDHGIALCVHDRDCRPKWLKEGEVTMYTCQDGDKVTRHRVHLMENRRIEIWSKTLLMSVDDDWDVYCDHMYANLTSGGYINAAGQNFTIFGDEIALSGNWGGLRALIDERMTALFNAHVHPDPVAGNTGVPTVAMGAGQQTSKVKGL